MKPVAQVDCSAFQQFVMMALRYGCQLNFTEIAAILNTSGESVRNTLRQGRWRVVNLEQA